MSADFISPLEEQLHAQLGEIGRQISKLMAEREALQRVLLRVGGSPGSTAKGPRRNSHERLLVEKNILDAIRASEEKALSTRDLFRIAKAANPQIKDATFRSHLHRLKKRELLEPHGDRRGHWRYKVEKIWAELFVRVVFVQVLDAIKVIAIADV